MEDVGLDNRHPAIYCEIGLIFFVALVLGTLASWWGWTSKLPLGWFTSGGLRLGMIVVSRMLGPVFVVLGLYAVPTCAWIARKEIIKREQLARLAEAGSIGSILEWLEDYVGRVTTPSEVAMNMFVALCEKCHQRPELHRNFLKRMTELRSEHRNLDRALVRAEARARREEEAHLDSLDDDI